MLIVNTDHGFLLGEHGWWAKCAMPFYDEIIHTPLLIWDPRCKIKGECRKSLVQTIDLAPTLLYDLVHYPAQEHPIHDEHVEQQMIKHMVRLMIENHCPEEQWVRLGLEYLRH